MKMTNYFQAKIVLETENEDGRIKKIRENYLIKAISVSDAETKLATFFKDVKLDYRVISVSESNIVDVID